MTPEQIEKIARAEVVRLVRLDPDNYFQHIVSELTKAIRILEAHGYAVVPVEPTEAMLRAGDDCLEFPDDEDGCSMRGGDEAANIYRAMLNAAKDST